MSPRPPMPVGTYGSISYSGTGPVEARARFRDYNGKIRRVAKTGQTKTAARHALLEVLRDRQRTTAGDTITGNTTVEQLADAWLASEAVAKRAVNTQKAYSYVVKNQVKPALGGVRLAEVSTATVNRALRAIKTGHGAGAAKTTRTALSGMFKLAVDEEAMQSNPVRDAISTAAGRSDPVRALTRDEVDDLADRLRTDKAADALDLPDLVDFMLATGCRIGEACSIGHANCAGENPHQSVDLDAGTVEIDSTLIRVTGQGLSVQHRTKSDAGWRVLALPPYAVAMLQRRATELRMRAPDGVVFGNPRSRTFRDPSSNAGKDLRAALDRLGYEWVHSHTFRKTVATRMDEAGRSAREIADQLGHAKASMTLDVYMGRNVVSAAAAQILDR